MNNNKLLFCKNCFTPNTRPRIKFNKGGLCNACEFIQNRNRNTNFEKRSKELIELCDKFRKNNGDHDCIVPWSGGKIVVQLLIN